MDTPDKIAITHPELIGLEGVVDEGEVVEAMGTYETEDPDASNGVYFMWGDRRLMAPEGTFEVVYYA